MRLQMRHEVLENGLFDRFAFGCGLDDQVRLSQLGQGQGGCDPVQRCRLVVVGDFAARHLPFQIAVDRGHPGGQRVFGDVVECDRIARQCHDMCDSVAHLARADDANCLDIHSAHPFVRRTIGRASQRGQEAEMPRNRPDWLGNVK